MPEGWVRVTCRACGYAADYTEACMGAALPCGGCHAPIACYRAVADGRTAIGVPLGTQTSHSALLERMTMMDVTADGSHRAAAVRLGDSTYGAWVVMEHPMAGAPRRVLVKTTGSFELDAPADPDWHRLTRFPTPQEGMGCYRHWCEPAP